MKQRFKVDKLIRDKVPDILQGKGIEIGQRVMDPIEYLQRLKEKCVEEAHEVLAATTPNELQEELGDLLEVIHSLCAAAQLPMAQVEAARLKKQGEKGGFSGRIYNAYVQMEADHPNINYYRHSPDKYPELRGTCAPWDPLSDSDLLKC